jgi:hypothetical protein
MADEKKTGKRDDAKDVGENKGGPMPPAGPHADPRLMNPDATPGSGAIAPIGETDEPNIQPTS